MKRRKYSLKGYTDTNGYKASIYATFDYDDTLYGIDIDLYSSLDGINEIDVSDIIDEYYAIYEIQEKWFYEIKDWEASAEILSRCTFVDFHVPFKHGDILVRKTNPEPWNKQDMPDIFVFTTQHDTDGEFDYFAEVGYFVDDVGALYDRWVQKYENCEYYNGKLEGKDRTLYYFSQYLKRQHR
jgi:hypothetical protein